MALNQKVFFRGMFLLLLFGFTFTLNSDNSFCLKKALAKAPENQQEEHLVDYRKSMIELIGKISSYAKNKNNSFQLIQNAGLPLFEYAPNNAGGELLKKTDAVLLEGLYYSWKLDDFQRTPSETTRAIETALKIPKNAGLTILNIDYCNRVDMINNSLKLNKKSNIIGFAAQDRNLDRIPKYPWQIPHENDISITGLNQIKNFLTLLNPGRFTAKQRYLDYLQDTNYDLLIIDLNFKGKPLLPQDVAFLKKKKNGAARLVFAYMSIGEAENYRSYWQESWSKTPPYWLDESNLQWEGNFKVKYWSKEWQQILFGSNDSYLDTILSAGFDGVFLDVVDAYDYFEHKQIAGEEDSKN